MDIVKRNREPTVLDLFCGAGGLSIGFDKAGYDVLCGVDNYEHSIDTWKKNHNGKGVNKDISTLAPSYVEDLFEDKFDIIIGGPPCKDFSKANQVVDFGRNNLVLVFAKFVSELQPDAFVMENVRQLTTQYEEVFNDFKGKLDDKYNIRYRLLDSADYGVPQHRIRAFVIGIKESVCDNDNTVFPMPTHGPDSDRNKELISAGEAIKNIDSPKDPEEYKSNSKHSHLLDDIPPGMNYSFYTEKLGHPDPKFEWRSRFSDFLYKADPNKPVRTLKAKPGAASGPFHWNNRRFTEDELKRLQSFSDSFVFSTDSYSHITRMIGNSVPPAQSYAIASALKKNLNSDFKLMDSNKNLNFLSRRRTSTEEYREKAKNRINEIYNN